MSYEELCSEGGRCVGEGGVIRVHQHVNNGERLCSIVVGHD